MTEIVYLAGPYTKGSPDTRLARFHALTHVAAKLIEKKTIVYSPITMTHPIDLVLAADGETLGSDFWTAFDEAFMAGCSKICVLTLPGWKESSGVAREIAYFRVRGSEPEYLDPAAFGIEPKNPKFAAAFQISSRSIE